VRYGDIRKLQHELIPINIIHIIHATPAAISRILIFNTKPRRRSQHALQSKYQDVALAGSIAEPGHGA
jgi:hypothetical protein